MVQRGVVLWETVVKRKWVIFGVVSLLIVALMILGQHTKSMNASPSHSSQPFETEPPAMVLSKDAAPSEDSPKDDSPRDDSSWHSLSNSKLSLFRSQKALNEEDWQAQRGITERSLAEVENMIQPAKLEQGFRAADVTAQESSGTPLYTPEEEAMLTSIRAELDNGNPTDERAAYLMELERSIMFPKNPERVVIEERTSRYYYMPAGKGRFPEDAVEISRNEAEWYISQGVGQIIYD